MSTKSSRARYLILAGLAALVGVLVLLQLSNLRGCQRVAREQRDGGSAALAARPRLAPGTAAGPGERLLESLTLEGVVIDQQGKRQPRAAVLLNGPVKRETTTDDKGEFAIADLNPNSYDVEAFVEDAAGGPVRVHLTRDTKPITIRVFAAGRLEVTVVTTDDKPIAEADVSLRVGGNQRNLVFLRAGKTDKDGKLLIRGVPVSGYFVVVWAKGFQPKVEPLDAPAGLRWVHRVVLEPGVSVSGRVVDEKGTPVAGAHVNVVEPITKLPLVQPRVWPFSATTDQNGAFTVHGAAAGQRQVKVGHPEFELGTSEAFIVGKAPISGILVTLRRGTLISGWVTIGGQPAPFATVRASTGGSVGRTFFVETTCDASGRFKMGGLLKGVFYVLAQHDSVQSEPIPVDLSKGDKTDVLLPLTIDGTVSGRVLAPSREPIAAAVVICNSFVETAVGLRPVIVETTEADGSFTCRGLPKGDVMISAEKPGPNNNIHAGLRGTSTRATIGSQGIELIIPDDGSLTGRVTLQGGAPAKQFQVSLVTGLKPREIQSEEGRFTLDGLAPKEYKLTVKAAGHKSSVVPVTVKEGQPTDVGEITLEAGEDPPPPSKVPRLRVGTNLSDLMEAHMKEAAKGQKGGFGDPDRPPPPPDPPPK